MNYQLARNNLLNAVRLVVAFTKTYDYYIMAIKGLVTDLYYDNIDASQFGVEFAELVNQQLTRAWEDGMRENGLDPVEEMEPEWQEILDKFITDEYDYIFGYADDIIAARDGQLPLDPLLSRADLWANRYNDVVTKAIVVTGVEKLIWIYGDTEHCDDCLQLNGIVAWAHEWDEAGIRPQSSDLECGGWRCQCQLIPTSNRHTRDGLNRIMEIIG